MKLLFCSDIHGDEAHYERLVRVAGRLHPDLIVLGGDMLPDDSALERRNMGVGQPAYVRGRFRNHLEHLRQASGCRAIYTVFGNHDWGSSVTAMSELEAQGLVTVLDLQRTATMDGVSFVGYSCTPPTPWYVKDFERLDMPGDRPPLLGGARWDHRFNRPSTHGAHVLFSNVRTMQEELSELSLPSVPWIFVCHAPPAESRLDRYYGNMAWGSRAVRAALEKNRPFLSLHGHIHESPAVTGEITDRIGETTCVNPGQGRSELLYAEIAIDAANARVKRIEHGRER